MLFITSFGPSRIERQQQCLHSWLGRGHRVIGIQSPGEKDALASHFGGAELRETRMTGDAIGLPHLVQIRAMLDTVVEECEPAIIINSDIEVTSRKQQFADNWAVPNGKQFKVGIRWDVNQRTGRATMFMTGIDAFLVTPDLAIEVGNIGLVMGHPWWDYWLPLEADRIGYEIVTIKDRCLLHEWHPLNWSKNGYLSTQKHVEEQCGISGEELALLIQKLTRRRIPVKRRMKRRGFVGKQKVNR